ncbi:uncharacterized protein LOC105231677 [Bactrocera dorsalis]|uniref:Uncharacterized protein LOC105231677 n=1 Tax=Bactrocera dorsalis TaxID=27457 RepID=A0A6I9W3K7_BACDO|nr:uncharacterized protein LOC105231677 [Bactrocera dorsalis]
MLATFYNLTALLRFCEALTLTQDLAFMVQNIAEAASQEQRHVHTIIYISQQYRKGEEQFQAGTLLAGLHSSHNPWPMLSFNAAAPIRRFWDNFNNNYIVVARLAGQRQADVEFLQVLWQRLWQNTQSRIILLLNDDVSAEYVARILNYCATHNAMNVIALRPKEAVLRRSYWTLSIFPVWQVVRRTFLTAYRRTFPQHLGNMHGQRLRIATSNSYPQCYLMRDAHGNAVVSGHIGKIFVEYARRHNATLVYPFGEIQGSLFVDRLDDLVQNGSADMNCQAAYENPNRNLSYSRMFDSHHWCLMVPMEQPLPPATYFFIIFDKATLIMMLFGLLALSFTLTLTFYLQGAAISFADLVFNAPILQGLLGQTFWMESRTLAARSAIYAGISVAGIIFSTTYGTYLQSFNMRAPIEAPAETIPELLARGLKILIHSDEVKLFQLPVEGYQWFVPFIKQMTVVENRSEIEQLRNAFDTRYVYQVTSIWPIIEEQQKFFARPIFRLSNICPVTRWPMVISFSENSVHRWAINALLGDLQAAGLLAYWKRHAFIEMLQLDQINLLDKSEKTDFVPMKLEALYIVLSGLAVLELLAVVCLLLELVWAKRSVIFKSIFGQN